MFITIQRVATAPRAAAAGARVVVAMTIAITASAAGAASADESPEAVPYRPSVSTPASLSAPGWLEVEAGYLHERHEGERRRSVPLTLKLAFTPDWGIRVASDAWVQLRDESGRRESGNGDTSIIVKRRFAIDDASAFGLEGGPTLPSSRHLGPGSGKPDWTLNSIYSADFGAWHTDVNAALTRLGAVEVGAARTQVLGAASLSRSLDEHWGVVGEISGTSQRGADSSRQFLVAASYNVSKRLVLDAGAARSLRSGAPSWSAFTGFTWLARRIF
jgi:hypothetical protein